MSELIYINCVVFIVCFLVGKFVVLVVLMNRLMCGERWFVYWVLGWFFFLLVRWVIVDCFLLFGFERVVVSGLCWFVLVGENFV